MSSEAEEEEEEDEDDDDAMSLSASSSCDDADHQVREGNCDLQVNQRWHSFKSNFIQGILI